jgi:hypothetical protein
MFKSVVHGTPYPYYHDYFVCDFENYEVTDGNLVRLEPICVGSYFGEVKILSVRNSINFVDDFLEYMFTQARGKGIVNVIGFNSAKFDFTLLLPYLENDKWGVEPNSYIGTGTMCKQIIITHKLHFTKLRFLDLLLYSPCGDLRKLVETFGDGMEKGVFPYDVLNVSAESREEMVIELNKILNTSQKFSWYDFYNKLTNTRISIKNYAEYLEEPMKTRWDYLESYCLRDVEIMVKPINKMLGMFSELGIDMLACVSASSNANALKHKIMYSDFDVTADYNTSFEHEPNFIPAKRWAERRVQSYNRQDYKSERSREGNVTVKEIMKMNFEKYYMCQVRFTISNPPSFGRIENHLNHTPTNLRLACLSCNKVRGVEGLEWQDIRSN